MRRPEDLTPVEGLGDIVSNLMALFILLTMIVLLARVTAEAAADRPGRLAEADGGDLVARPFDTVTRPAGPVVVTATGFAVLDMPAIRQALAAAGRGGPVEVPGGIFVGAAEGEPTRVRNRGALSGDHALTAVLDIPLNAVPQALAVPGQTPAALVAALRARLPAGAAPDFIVFPDGMARFGPVYRHLSETGVCFRWTAWTRTQTAYTDRANPLRIRPASLMGRRECPA
ncbi:hypothetical protein [Pseudoponticoccus marisrubri]|uniref:Uncharacterized protein n=1 Tax=Pseudoponticoccus marisrubri TaxID=1685382 RepID=A0A0W7WPJ1_9RHOB|nr:hypothetical protein [Pseudoponticoccus marisrubri]KUF12449.1 hypothetical protein AVJ23_01585 [Pseudoponticoccus marisrubri]